LTCPIEVLRARCHAGNAHISHHISENGKKNKRFTVLWDKNVGAHIKLAIEEVISIRMAKKPVTSS
jgi:hypothetical protein